MLELVDLGGFLGNFFSQSELRDVFDGQRKAITQTSEWTGPPAIVISGPFNWRAKPNHGVVEPMFDVDVADKTKLISKLDRKKRNPYAK